MTGFNTQPPEGGWLPVEVDIELMPVSTHSRLKAAGCSPSITCTGSSLFQHTAA